MKVTGIVRRVDDLGRIVIPKEIRRQVGIREGEPLEFYLDTTSDGHPMICLAKYSTTFENDFANLIAQIANGMDDSGEYELSDKFREVIKEAAKILKEFENRGW